MVPMRARVTVALAMLTSAAAAEAAPIEVRHQPLPCVVADRFVRIAATASPAPRTAEVQFRTEPDGPWYALAMKPEDGEWAAVLPRPMASLAGFEYRISMAGEGPETSQTPAYAVKVAPDPSACAGAALSAVNASIVVHVPQGAPVVPPVPRGFNPGGVVGTDEGAPARSKKALVLGGAAAVAGGVAAVALRSGSEEAAASDLPDFVVEGSIPAPGNTVSLSGDTIQVLVRMSREPDQPLNFSWIVEWRQTTLGPVCVSMLGTFNGAQRPTDLVLSGPLGATPFCGASFDAGLVRLLINASGHGPVARSGELPFHFVR